MLLQQLPFFRLLVYQAVGVPSHLKSSSRFPPLVPEKIHLPAMIIHQVGQIRSQVEIFLKISTCCPGPHFYGLLNGFPKIQSFFSVPHPRSRDV